MLKAERISCSGPKLSDAQTRNFEAIKYIFPSRRSLIRTLGAVFSEMDEDREAGRWFSEESIAQALASAAPAAPSRAHGGTAGEHARRIIDVVLADNPIGRRAA